MAFPTWVIELGEIVASAARFSFTIHLRRTAHKNQYRRNRTYEVGLRLPELDAAARQRFDNHAIPRKRSIKIARRIDQLRRDQPLRRCNALHRGVAEARGHTAR